jgi:multisubunit Na+/H+ antiporter MnhB subunit
VALQIAVAFKVAQVEMHLQTLVVEAVAVALIALQIPTQVTVVTVVLVLLLLATGHKEKTNGTFCRNRF